MEASRASRVIAALLAPGILHGAQATARPSALPAPIIADAASRSTIADDGEGFVIRSVPAPRNPQSAPAEPAIPLGIGLHLDRKLIAGRPSIIRKTSNAVR